MDIYNDIKERKYIHAPYKDLILNDSKKRYISSPTFRDHILHHLVYSLIYDILDKKMVYSSFACRKGYWLHKWVLNLQKIIRKEKNELVNNNQFNLNKGELYYFKIDFSKYFFSINHDFLKVKIRKHIFDEEILYLVDLVIDSYKSSKIYDPILKDYDFYINENNKGLPIWWILSQLFANFYLNDFDQYLKHNLKVSFVRYMDDVIMIWEKSRLMDCKPSVQDFLLKQKLILHPKKISFHPLSAWVRFIWYMIKDDLILAWKRIKVSFQRFMDKFEEINFDEIEIDKRTQNRILSKYFSRTWCFKITNFWTNYIGKRGIIDFHPRG